MVAATYRKATYIHIERVVYTLSPSDISVPFFTRATFFSFFLLRVFLLSFHIIMEWRESVVFAREKSLVHSSYDMRLSMKHEYAAESDIIFPFRWSLSSSICFLFSFQKHIAFYLFITRKERIESKINSFHATENIYACFFASVFWRERHHNRTGEFSQRYYAAATARAYACYAMDGMLYYNKRVVWRSLPSFFFFIQRINIESSSGEHIRRLPRMTAHE